MFWVFVAIGILGLVIASWAVVHGTFDAANRVLGVIDESAPPEAAFPKGKRNDEL